MKLLVLCVKPPACHDVEVISVSSDIGILEKMRDAYIYKETSALGTKYDGDNYDYFYVERDLDSTVYCGSESPLFTEDCHDFNPK